jgi:hypothetical protein
VSNLAFRADSGNEDGRGSGLNDLGQIAFVAAFTDGTQGVFVSNRATVPEPGALGLIAMGLLVYCATRKRRISRGALARCCSVSINA